MTWFRIDDSIYDHPKTMELFSRRTGARAFGLWAKCGAWCSKHLTDGWLPKSAARSLGLDKKTAEQLADVGFFEEPKGDGYQYHDWADWQPTKAEVLAKREAKSRAGKAGGKASGESRRQSKGEAGASDSVHTVRTPSRPDPLILKTVNHSDPQKGAQGSERSRSVREVFEYWMAAMGKRSTAKLTDDRRRKIESRLRDGYTVEQLKRAIDGCKLSPHHMGENEQNQPYNGIETIFKTSSKVEWHIARLDRPNSRPESSAAHPEDFEGVEDPDWYTSTEAPS